MKVCWFMIAVFLLSCAGKNSSSSSSQADSTSEMQSAAQEETSQKTSIADSLSSAGASLSVFPYNLDHPSEKFKLPDDLTEISGIDVYHKSKLVCVNDEQGKVYIYDVKKSELKQGVDFGKKGDYEGITNVNDTIYVLSSNGNLHQITGFDSKDQKAHQYKTPLNESNDTEGLCYDLKYQRLLIACKKDPGKEMKGVRAIYSFDLKNMQLNPDPVYVIRLEALKNFLLEHDQQKLIVQDVQSFFDPQKGDLTFQPSEVAIHPVTDEIYIISTVGKLMVVLNRKGEILYIRSLNPEIFKQPEGLCFTENGDMYISDEGRNGKGNILYFQYTAAK